MSGKLTRVLSDAQITVVLEREARDERGEVPAPETLIDFDGLLELGLVDPDLHFLIKRVEGGKDPDKLEDAVRGALAELLRERRQRPDIPLSPQILDMAADLLERGLNPEAEKQRRRLEEAWWKRAYVEMAEAVNRQQGTPRPRGKAWDDAAKHFRHNSGKALRRALQANRVNSKPGCKPRG